MADWSLVPCLVKLRSEFNTLAPARDKSSDGSIGDTAHSATQSDHNPDSRGLVHAIDVDVDLREAGLSMELVVQHLLRRCRAGAENRLKYIIYNRRIWAASSGWVQQYYDGPNPHDHHAHFSASYVPAREQSTASWHLEDLDMALDATDLAAVKAQVNSALGDYFERSGTGSSITSKIGRDALDQGVPNGVTGQPSTAWSALTAIGQQVMAVKALVVALAAQADDVNEAQIITGVLAGMTPERLGAAFTAAGFTPQALAAMVPAEMRKQVADELRDRLAA